MSEAQRGVGRRRGVAAYWPVLAAVALVVVAAIAVARVWFFRDDARAVSTEEAVERFREVASTPSSTSDPASPVTSMLSPPSPVMTPVTVGPSADSTVPATAPPTTPTTGAPRPLELPQPGVYRYATSGQEEIDAVGGARHDYPPETTITLTPAGCGVRLQWDALRERRETWELCVGTGGIELQPDAVQYHEFFSQPQEHAVECDRTAVLVPLDPDSAPATQLRCTVAGEPWFPTWEVLERTTREVAGSEIEVVHVQMTVRDDDEYWETTTIDWFLGPTGLPVVVRGETSSKTSTLVGDVTYSEQYDLSLASLTPLG